MFVSLPPVVMRLNPSELDAEMRGPAVSGLLAQGYAPVTWAFLEEVEGSGRIQAVVLFAVPPRPRVGLAVVPHWLLMAALVGVALIPWVLAGAAVGLAVR